MDWDAYNQLKGLLGDKFDMVIDNYVQTATKLIDGIAKAVEESDATALRDNAHPLKSSSAQVGAMEVSEFARVLEEMGMSGTVEGAAELVPQIQSAFADTCNDIKNA